MEMRCGRLRGGQVTGTGTAGAVKLREESVGTGARHMVGGGGVDEGPSPGSRGAGGNWAKHPCPHPSVLQTG